jgi:CheY-like chemotaxis protein
MDEPLRILILEDSPVDAELMQFELQEAGLSFTAKVVMTEEDYIREALEYAPDIILSDYDLPRYNGALALAEARRRCPDTPFILVTGAVTENRAIEILTQGAKDYVLKNRLEQRLAPAVRRALAEAEEHRARNRAEAELHEAYGTLKEKDEIRAAERKAETEARKRMEEALREREARDTAHTAELRLRAKEHLKAIKAASCPSELGADTQKLLQELQIYQIELEMQNEELKRARDEAEALMARYHDIYDFAPISYLTLNPKGHILRVNLTAAGFLGAERSRLTGQRFQLHVSRESHLTFGAFLEKTFKSDTIEHCEVMLQDGGGGARHVRLHARLSSDRKECDLAMIDITDHGPPESAPAEQTRQPENLKK